MTAGKFIKKSVISLGLLVSIGSLVPAAYAEQTQGQATGLRSLAQEFVQKMKKGFDEADHYYRTYYAGDMRGEESFVDIPDGEILLLEIILPQNLKLPDPVMAIKQGRDVLLSLTDFTNVARFKIDVLPEERRAEGWFIRQEKGFVLDAESGAVQSAGQAYQLQPGDILEQDNDIYVRADALSAWMGFDMKVSLQRQNIGVTPTEKWPVQEAFNRKNRKGGYQTTPPVMPRQEDPYSIVGPMNVDINIRQHYRRPADAEATHRTDYFLRSDGDLAAHTATTVISGTREDPLTSARFTMSKESDQPDLLGPLGARKYEFGDINPARVRLAGPSKGGLGARATNKNSNVTTDSTTRVEIEGTPGWDVELFRGSQLLGSGVVDETGRFIFEDVFLVPGENLFRIVQYGPFGEITEDKQSFYAGTDLLNRDGFSYDVSVTAADTRFYNPDDYEAVDKGEPHLAMEFEKQILDSMTARAGAVSATTGEARKQYVTSGITASLGQSLVSLDGAYDVDGAWQTAASARRQFGSMAAGISAGYSTAAFGAEDDDLFSDGSYYVSGTTRSPVATWGDRPVVLATEHEYRASESGASRLENQIGLSGYLSRINLGQSFGHVIEETESGEKDEAIEGNTNVSGPLWGARWRFGTNYEISPESEINRYTMDVTKSFQRDLRGNLRVDHEPVRPLTKGTASLTYSGEHASITPSITYDSDGNLSALLNFGVGLAYDPLSSSVVFSGRTLAGMGGVSARVYLDKDGSFTFNEGDELLPDVTIEAVHANRRAVTDEDGIAFLYNLPAGRLTDVVVLDNSLPDALWIAGRQGVSVLPRPGNATELDFPIHMAGEIDGTVYKVLPNGNKTPLRGMTLNLHRASDGHLEASSATAMDGFYIFDRIRPGEYLLLLSPGSARAGNVTAPAPQRITIGYEGTMVYGNNIMVPEGPAGGIGFVEDLEGYAQANPQIDIESLKRQPLLFNLGSYNSHLAMSLSWLQAKQISPRLREFGSPVVEPGSTIAFSSDQKYTLRVTARDINPEQAQAVCREIGAHKMPCTVELIPAATADLAHKQP